MSSLNNPFILNKILTFCSNNTVFNLITLNKRIFKNVCEYPLIIEKWCISNDERNFKYNWKYDIVCINILPKVITSNIYKLSIFEISSMVIDLEILSGIHDLSFHNKNIHYKNIEKLKNIKVLEINSSYLKKRINSFSIPTLNTLIIYGYCKLTENNFINLKCLKTLGKINIPISLKDSLIYFSRYKFKSREIIRINKLNLVKPIHSICTCHGVNY